MKAKSSPTAATSRSSKKAGIICGTDFTENAREAVGVAAAIAGRMAAPLLLVHTLDFSSDTGTKTSSAGRAIKGRAQEALDQEASRWRKTVPDVGVQLQIGRPDEALVNLARKLPTHMLVVASLGSVSERTAERATVPTLIVGAAAPFQVWMRKERALKVFVAFNLTLTAEGALRWVKELQALGPCEIVVGYVVWPPEVRAGVRRKQRDEQAILENDVRARVVAFLGETGFRVRVEVDWGRPDARLVEMAEEECADLIVVGSHQYRGFERLWHTSVSRGVLQGAKMSVAVVPRSTRENRAASIAPPVRRVLVTTDFSDAANRAIPHAYSLVRDGGIVRLMHVVHPLELPGLEYRHGLSDRRSRERHAGHLRACAKKLRTLIPPDAAQHGILTEIEVAESDGVASAIVAEAQRFGADVLCLGTHGESGMSKALLGSVAQTVTAKSTHPLFLVRSPEV